MPGWLIALVFALAFVACPVTMWLTSKLTRREIGCAAGGFDPASKGPERVIGLEARKAQVEREIALLRAEALPPLGHSASASEP